MISFVEFLVWLGSTGGSGAVISFIMERIPSFQKLSGEQRDWVSFLGMSCVGMFSNWMLSLPPETLALFVPYFSIIGGAFSAVFIGRIFHKQFKIKK